MMRSKCLSELTFDREWRSPLESIQAILEAMPRVCLSDLQAAMEWASDDMSDNEAYVCRETGKIYWVSEEPGLLDDEEETPGDIDNIEKYLPVPDKRDLDLGTRLVSISRRDILMTNTKRFEVSFVAEVLTGVSGRCWKRRTPSMHGMRSARRGHSSR